MSHTLHSVRFTFLLVAAFAFALAPAAAGLAQDEEAPPEQSQADEHRRDGQEVAAENRDDGNGDAETDDDGDDGNGDAETDDDGDDGNGDAETDDDRRGQQEARERGQHQARLAAETDDGEDDRSDEANRGSIKIHGTDWDGWPPRNEPHPGCDFLISFHGFSAEGATVTFFAWPPTGDQREILTDSVAFDPQDARGHELNAVVEYNLEAELAALAAEGFEPHPIQGWHIKVEADAEGTVGGPKQKVFWLDCPPPEEEEQQIVLEGEQQLGFEGEQQEGDEQELEFKDEQQEQVLGESLERQRQPAAAVEQEQAVAAEQEEAAAPGELPLTGGAAAATLIGFGLMVTSVALRRLMR